MAIKTIPPHSKISFGNDCRGQVLRQLLIYPHNRDHRLGPSMGGVFRAWAGVTAGYSFGSTRS
ncbi:hypothetical protein [Rhizobium laguerreae]|uniref:hypothetical protein n=1 Tax=Rhizobium laguerreae TaxID=1076926 RepID=UPI001C9061BD|nr:hypothetical protein [Rhizobium laguerreae]MBY3447190.1 hypothetical protein [Rhizobium laguerreae]